LLDTLEEYIRLRKQKDEEKKLSRVGLPIIFIFFVKFKIPFIYITMTTVKSLQIILILASILSNIANLH
jgi:hypothetical protein